LFIGQTDNKLHQLTGIGYKTYKKSKKIERKEKKKVFYIKMSLYRWFKQSTTGQGSLYNNSLYRILGEKFYHPLLGAQNYGVKAVML